MGEDLQEEKREVGISAQERSGHIAEIEEELQRGVCGEGSPEPIVLHGGCWMLPWMLPLTPWVFTHPSLPGAKTTHGAALLLCDGVRGDSLAAGQSCSPAHTRQSAHCAIRRAGSSHMAAAGGHCSLQGEKDSAGNNS